MTPPIISRTACLRFVVIAAALLPRAAADSAAAAQRSDTAPLNVVIILADDLGWSDLGCYGAELHETKQLDQLARDGVLFNNAYAAAPVCTPTRASIMTGKAPARLHMTIWYESSQNPPQNRKVVPPITIGNLSHAETTLAEVFNQAGYLAAHVGKWHLGDAAHYPETHGFDINIGGTFWGAPSTFFYPYRGFWSTSTEFRYVPGLSQGRPGEYLTDRLTDEALRIMESTKDRPFFLNLCYHTVHTPIEGKEDLVARYEKQRRPEHQHQNAVYAAMVHSLDENVGRVLAKLQQLGIAEQTLVVFVSDNGGFLKHRGVQVTSNQPLRSGKGSLYEGGIRVPMIVRWPGVTPAGAVCEEPVVTTDIYPTIVQAIGQGKSLQNRELDGRDIAPLLRNPKATLDRESLFFHYPHYYSTTTPVSAIRQGRWKLLEYLEDMRLELYDLQNDLGEQQNLAETQPEIAARLREQLHQWREDVDAQMPQHK